ncbi:eukaryotic translation initiation factor 4E1-like [Vanessa cardui]|uniref:eukaryotic translation initiation factor 4E1-like n=1 Tax=Vanessa cardui TaxID=171605 RepID=UPI001F1438D5|nr:eukaryotic translation initiation factor 4E1-like [Vanessa cardui]
MGGKREKKVIGNYDSEKNNDVVNNNVVKGVKHPLNNSWSFWMFTNKKSVWEENLIKLTTFDTVEDYWSLYHHMKCPSGLDLGQEYAIFKDDIRPMWEDKANKFGGRWVINLEKTQNSDLDAVWLYVVLLLIGNNFENSDAICGAVVNIRQKSKIGIWISDSRNKKAIDEIGRKLKFNLSLQSKINFHAHNSNKNIFTL